MSLVSKSLIRTLVSLLLPVLTVNGQPGNTECRPFSKTDILDKFEALVSLDGPKKLVEEIKKCKVAVPLTPDFREELVRKGIRNKSVLDAIRDNCRGPACTPEPLSKKKTTRRPLPPAIDVPIPPSPREQTVQGLPKPGVPKLSARTLIFTPNWSEYRLGVPASEMAVPKPIQPPETKALSAADISSMMEQSARSAEKKGNCQEAIELYKKSADAGNAQACNRLAKLYLGFGNCAVRTTEGEAIRLLRSAVGQGLPEAMATLAFVYEHGKDGAAPNKTEAAKWYKAGAEIGDPLAMYGWALKLQFGLGVQQDYPAALEWYGKAINASSSAEVASASMVRSGDINLTLGNGSVAVEWYRRAANRGDTEGLKALGWMYEVGRGGLKPNDAEAAKLYEDAIEKWYPVSRASTTLAQDDRQGRAAIESMYRLGRLNAIQGRYAAAFSWMTKAAGYDHMEATTVLGQLYELGLGTTGRSYEEALKAYRKAAGNGFAPAIDNLGWMYEAGRGVQRDYNEAIKWYRLAAGKSDPGGMNDLGHMYETSAPQADFAEAFKWYTKAAEAGDRDGMYNLGRIYELGRPFGRNFKAHTREDRGTAVAWYSKAAKLGSPDAMYKLGMAYSEGVLGKPDYSEAVRWFQAAADYGVVDAMNCLAKMLRQGRGIKKDKKTADIWSEKAAKASECAVVYTLQVDGRFKIDDSRSCRQPQDRPLLLF